MVHIPVSDEKSVTIVRQTAQTPFGSGKVRELRKDGGVNVELDWTLSDGKSAVAYLPKFSVAGSRVITPFGKGVVYAQREDGGVNVNLDWVLSDGKNARAFIPRQGYFVSAAPITRGAHNPEPTACKSVCAIL